MYIIVCCDVKTESAAGRKRLRRVAKACEACGQRVQNSIFECQLDSVQKRALVGKLLKIIDQDEDSLRIYNLGKNYRQKIEHWGTKNVPDLSKDTIIF
ncbi:MAG: CRISPR-associated endonuclease Cas2 [Eubacteriales bacterium]|nr:CRISPR-associated endonuclease Cas2 [Eubacteriales bacterium]